MCRCGRGVGALWEGRGVGGLWEGIRLVSRWPGGVGWPMGG